VLGLRDGRDVVGKAVGLGFVGEPVLGLDDGSGDFVLIQTVGSVVVGWAVGTCVLLSPNDGAELTTSPGPQHGASPG